MRENNITYRQVVNIDKCDIKSGYKRYTPNAKPIDNILLRDFYKFKLV